MINIYGYESNKDITDVHLLETVKTIKGASKIANEYYKNGYSVFQVGEEEKLGEEEK